MSIARSGTEDGAGGIRRDESQPSTEITTMRARNERSAPSWSPDARLPPIVPIRMAMKVAPSIRALPAGSSLNFEMRREKPVFHGTEEGARGPEQNERDEQQRHRRQEKSGGGQNRNRNLDQAGREPRPSPCRTCRRAARRARRRERMGGPAPRLRGSRGQGRSPLRACRRRASRARSSSRLSFNAARSWLQNSGAKRRDDIKRENIEKRSSGSMPEIQLGNCGGLAGTL